MCTAALLAKLPQFSDPGPGVMGLACLLFASSTWRRSTFLVSGWEREPHGKRSLWTMPTPISSDPEAGRILAPACTLAGKPAAACEDVKEVRRTAKCALALKEEAARPDRLAAGAGVDVRKWQANADRSALTEAMQRCGPSPRCSEGHPIRESTPCHLVPVAGLSPRVQASHPWEARESVLDLPAHHGRRRRNL